MASCCCKQFHTNVVVVVVPRAVVVVVVMPLVFICRNFTIFSLTCAKWPISWRGNNENNNNNNRKVKGKCGKIETKPQGYARMCGMSIWRPYWAGHADISILLLPRKTKKEKQSGGNMCKAATTTPPPPPSYSTISCVANCTFFNLPPISVWSSLPL